VKQRFQISIKGAVQGVGFRPFIYKVANELNLKGTISNNIKGVSIDVEGEEVLLKEFINRIKSDKPKHSLISAFEINQLKVNGYDDFKIVNSSSSGDPTAIIQPDISVCDECLAEMFDPNNRRYLYPFINCTNCGPRFSIIKSLPYDRPNTSMRLFEMCDDCKEEYSNPNERRFHAQPIACSKCGPNVKLLDNTGELICEKYSAIKTVVEKINHGKVIALKGLGGFQLIVNASDDNAIRELRNRKHRDEKPFALMFPSIEIVKEHCIVSDVEEKLLKSPESPIVLLRKKSCISDLAPGIRNLTIGVQSTKGGQASSLSEFVSPQNPYLGVMLPYTPLHHLIMKDLLEPIIATSGNISEEPMCIDEKEALEKLAGIADYFLVHNRPIIRPVDDSVIRVVKSREMILRRARGYAPLPISIRNSTEENFISVGAHLKNVIALKKGNEIFNSQHIGDLSNTEAEKYFEATISDFQKMYKVNPDFLVHDLHPDYSSTKYCLHNNIKTIEVQHHLAHIAACYEEKKLNGNCFAVCWDGTGYGFDKTIWGGEFFTYDESDYKHIAQFRQFRLPGGEAAVKDSRRSLIGILYDIFKDDIPYPKLSFSDSQNELTLFVKMLQKNINCFTTSSMGRIFDAVSSLLNLCHKSFYEGQAAMMLEFAADETVNTYYNFSLIEGDKFIIDWQPMFEEILNDLEKKIPATEISSKFHNTLIEVIITLSKRIGLKDVILTGGCFQNKFLLERTIDKLIANGFTPHWNEQIPPNDGGISFGQAVFANHYINRDKKKDFVINESLKE